jgi:hypothetical protein
MGWSGHGGCVRSGPEMTLKGVSLLAGKVCMLTALTLMTYAEASELIEVLEDWAGPIPVLRRDIFDPILGAPFRRRERIFWLHGAN